MYSVLLCSDTLVIHSDFNIGEQASNVQTKMGEYQKL